jgi:hypothetical protein
MSDLSSFNGTGIKLYNQSSGPTSGSSPVGQAARNSPQGRQVFGQQGQQYRDIIAGVLGQEQGQYDQAVAQQNFQGMSTALGYQMQMDQLRKQLGLAGGQAGIANSNNAIDRAALDRQGPLLDQLLGLDKSANGRSLDDLVFNLGQGRASLDQQGQQLDYSKLRGTQNAQTSAADQEWGLRSDATAKGAVGSQGERRGYASIQDQLQKSLGDIDKQFGWNKADLDRSRGSLEQNAKSGYGSIMDQNTRLDVNDAENRAKLEDDKKRLDNAAKSIGLSSAETKSRIDGQLSKLGLDSMMSSFDVLQGLDDLRNNRGSNLASAISTMEQLYGIDFNQFAGSQ